MRINKFNNSHFHLFYCFGQSIAQNEQDRRRYHKFACMQV